MPQAFGAYQLVDELGHGGTGTVYRAIHEPLGRTVALKVFHIQKSNELYARFHREIHCAVRLDHPYLVKVFDAGEVDDVLFISMQLVEGRPLSEIMEATTRFSWQQSLTLMLPIVEA